MTRLNMFARDRARGGGRDVAVERGRAVSVHHFDHRLAVAHAVAADGLDAVSSADAARFGEKGSAHGLRAARHAARAQADANLEAGAHTGSSCRAASRAAYAVAGVRPPAVR